MISRLVSRWAAMITIAAFAGAQMPQGFAQTPASAASTQTQSIQATANQVTVPAGTQIPLTLINPIHSKSSKPGDAVRATVAFPVTVGGVVAIPAGSYAEGMLRQVTVRAKGTNQPRIFIHFTRLLFPNGYSVPLDAENTQAELGDPTPDAAAPESADAKTPAMEANPEQAESASGAFPGAHLVRASYVQNATQPTPPPLPNNGPPMGAIAGAAIGGTFAIVLTAILVGRHRMANTDFTLYDAGWQFQIALASPVAIDLSRANAAPAH